MTEDQRADLVAALRTNPAFAEAFTKATTAEEAVAVAAEHGLNLTPAQVTAALTGLAGLSDSELANASGGTYRLPTVGDYCLPADTRGPVCTLFCR